MRFGLIQQRFQQDGILAITDTQYYRILIWKNWEDAFIKTADVIIGQPDLDSCGQNQYKGKPQANTLNWCYDTCIKDGSIWIADTGNSRVLYFKNVPIENNQSADDLYGNTGFDAIGEHLDVGKEGSEKIYWPFALNVTNDQLIVADTGNHRIIFYKL